MKTEDTLKDVMATVLGIVADSINEDTSMDTVWRPGTPSST